MKTHILKAIFILTAALSLLTAGCTQSGKKVSYSQDVSPILKSRCHECHLPGGQGYEASGLNMVDYEGLMKGTKFGPIIKPGDSLSSTLVILIEGRADKAISMPHGREPLSAEQIATIKNWINQGANNN